MHMRAPDGTPMANVWLSAFNLLGVHKDKFGNSTEATDLNPAVVTTAA